MNNKLIIKLESYIDNKVEYAIITINDKIIGREHLASIKAKSTSNIINQAIKSWCNDQFIKNGKKESKEGISAKELIKWANENGLTFSDPSDIPIE
jgi:arsenate reductase-like glutaredoxin family protein